MNKERIRKNLQNCNDRDNEDMPILDFIDTMNHGQEMTMLEVGSGECRFVKKIAKLYPNIKITCLEINPDLAQIARNLGFEVINENVLNVKPKKLFDIVNCSHVIEHFPYPQVTQLLDYLVASTRENGHFIIRAPLLHKGFYTDIDHIRPYPPESILNYFNLKQQQKQSKATVKVVDLWYRTAPKKLEYPNTWNWSFAFRPVRSITCRMLPYVNNLYKSMWNKYRFPSTKPTGFVLILKLLSRDNSRIIQ